MSLVYIPISRRYRYSIEIWHTLFLQVGDLVEVEPTKLVEEYITRITKSYKKKAVDAVNVVEKVKRLKKGR